ncbi:MAG TPA: TIGR03960 family B12-binding radical SAM protein [Candidatus Limnocylindrales bacterium]|nr:TIGR03960 family B12-binding radical SAM protein [Candidatus Limnocylindrales bacterium]
MSSIENKLKQLLLQVQKPARYLGNEWNAIVKDHAEVAVRMVLAFPDLYEVGMSNQGLKILYASVNQRPRMLLERVFAPAVDMEALMREHDVPLFSLESQKPVADFDVVGFSLQYELSYTNVLNMLELANIPLYSSERKAADPLVIGGGPCAFNPEPLAPFFDLFVLGEAEEALPELLTQLIVLKDKNLTRNEILVHLCAMGGIYVPSFYKPIARDGIFCGLEKIEPRAPSAIRKRVVSDLDSAPYPTAPIVPYIQTVHDRAVIEIFRGCSRGCRFCQAGYVFRPVRRRSRAKIVELAEEIISATGYDEVSLSSLSSSDYPQVDILIKDLGAVLDSGKVKCSLPSLRLDSYSVKLADQLHQGRRSSLTFAPEAAPERLRRVIKKNISEEDIFMALGAALTAGWQGFKLYFMIGLPTEAESDVESIVSLCRTLRQRLSAGSRRRINLTVSISTFVPKAHTPFQWEPQLHLEQVRQRQRLLRDGLKKMPGVDFSWHEPEASFLEAVFARGDRNLAPVLEKAWQLGCRFDGWMEHFSFQRWKQAFQALNVDAESYAYRHFNYEDALFWDHLNCGVDKDVLIREHQYSVIASLSEEAVHDQD